MASAIYSRVSTDEQGRSGLGLEAQETAARACALRLGVDGGQVFTDAGLSGATSIDKRPGLLAAVAELRRGDLLIVAKRDRLGRDPIVVAMIERLVERKGARIVSAAGEGTEGDDPTAVLMRRIVDSFAEYERLVIGARTKAALGAKRARGEKTGGAAPFGYRVDADGRTLVEVPAEQDSLRVVEALRAEGLSVRAIAQAMNARGLRTRKGTEWTHTQIHRLIRRSGAAA